MTGTALLTDRYELTMQTITTSVAVTFILSAY